MNRDCWLQIIYEMTKYQITFAMICNHFAEKGIDIIRNMAYNQSKVYATYFNLQADVGFHRFDVCFLFPCPVGLAIIILRSEGSRIP